MTANDGRLTAVSQAPRKILIENKSKRGKTVQTMYERKKTGAKKLPPPLIFRPCPAKLSPRTHANNERQFIILGITSSPHGSGSPIQISFEYVCLHIGFGLGSDADGGSIIWRDLDITLFYYGIAVAVAVSVFSCASHVPPHQAPDLSRNISSRRRNTSRSIAIADTANATVTTHQAPHRSRRRSRSRRNISRSIAIADTATATATVTTHQASPHRTTRNTSRSIAIADTANVTTRQASPHRTTRNTSRSIAIADSATIVVMPHQAPDRRSRSRRNISRGIAVADTAVLTVIPHQAPGTSMITIIRSRSRDTSATIAVADSANVPPRQAPGTGLGSSRRSRNSSRGIAMADTAVLTVIPHQAPGSRTLERRRRRRNTSRGVAIADTVSAIPRQAPGINPGKIRRRSRRRNRRRNNISRSMTIADTWTGTIVIAQPYQAPGINMSRSRSRRNTSGRVGVTDRGVFASTHQAPGTSPPINNRRPSSRSSSGNSSRSMAIADTAAVTPHQAPGMNISNNRRSRNASRGIAVVDRGAVTPRQAPGISLRISNPSTSKSRRSRNTSRSIAVADRGAVSPHQAPGISLGRRRGRRRRNISRSIAPVNSPLAAKACQNTRTLFAAVKRTTLWTTPSCDSHSAYTIHAKVFDNGSVSYVSKKTNHAYRAIGIKIIYAKVSSVKSAGEYVDGGVGAAGTSAKRFPS